MPKLRKLVVLLFIVGVASLFLKATYASTIQCRSRDCNFYQKNKSDDTFIEFLYVGPGQKYICYLNANNFHQVSLIDVKGSFVDISLPPVRTGLVVAPIIVKNNSTLTGSFVMHAYLPLLSQGEGHVYCVSITKGEKS